MFAFVIMLLIMTLLIGIAVGMHQGTTNGYQDASNKYGPMLREKDELIIKLRGEVGFYEQLNEGGINVVQSERA